MVGGMLSGGKARKRRGVPLTALTPQARAAGNPGLEESQHELVAAWLSLPKAAQRQVVIDVMNDGRDEMEPGDLPGGSEEEAPVEDAAPPPAEEPVVADQGGAVVGDTGPWSPPDDGDD